MGLFGGGGVTFTPDKDIPDLSGKVIIVTGGNIGLGQETILQLCKHNPTHIYLAARNEAKAQEAIKQIKEKVPSAAPISHLPLDLSSFSSIQEAADSFKATNNRLDILINNAGIMACPPSLTKEGYEIEFGTNHVGHALLTKLLLPTLQQTKKGQPDADVRIINVSSEAHKIAPRGGMAPSTYKTDMKEYNAFTRYGQSKLANVHFTTSLAQHYPDITSVAIHPGAVNTNLGIGPQTSYPRFAWLVRGFVSVFGIPVEEGAKNQLWASVSNEVKNGVFYYPVGKEVAGSQHAQDKTQADDLWQWTEKEFKDHGY